MLLPLWHALEEIPGTQASCVEWKSRLGSDWEELRSLLLPTDRCADCTPVPGDPYAVYRVVCHGPQHVIGVNNRNGCTIPLLDQDVLIYRLDIRKLGKTIASTLGLVSDFRPIAGASGTWMVGTYQAESQTPLPVFLNFPLESSDLQQAIEHLSLHYRAGFVVMIPTRRQLRTETDDLLRLSGGQLIVLCEVVTLGATRKWQANHEALQFLQTSSRASSQETILAPRSQDVLVAMLELGAVDSDHRRTTAEIAVTAFGRNTDENSLKEVIKELKRLGLINTKSSRGGGCWLTKDGKKRAEKLSQP